MADEDQLALASTSAHRLTSRFSSLPVTKSDASIFRRLMSGLIDTLLRLDVGALPQELVQKLLAALDSCLATLEAGGSAKSPASIFLLSGPLARKLRTDLHEVGEAVQIACVVGGVSSPRESQFKPEELHQAQLPSLDQRGALAEALRQQLQAVASASTAEDDFDSEAAAATCVYATLLGQGVSAGVVGSPNQRSKLSAELQALATETRDWLTPDEYELLTGVSGALRYTDADDGSGNGNGGEAARGPSSSSQATPAAPAASGGGGGGGGSPQRPPRLVPLQQSLVCPISYKVMRDPVTTPSGHTYERSVIEAWLQEKGTDPQTREPLEPSRLVPARAVKAAIEEWLEAAGMTHDECDDVREGGDDLAEAPGPSGVTASSSSGTCPHCGGGPSTPPSQPTPADALAPSTPSPSPAYALFAGTTSWDEVPHLDDEVREHLVGAGVGPAVARALVEVTGHIGMSDLREGGVDEAHVNLLGLRLLDRRRLMRALEDAQRPQEPPRLLSYVTVTPTYKDHKDATLGPLGPGKYGIVLMDDRSDDLSLRVRSLQLPYNTWWYNIAALRPVAAERVPAADRIVLPAWREGPPQGVPVTPYAGKRGMLVRRAYPGLREGAEGARRREEVGMLAESAQAGKKWKVYWASGGEEWHSTGEDKKFELQHLRVCALSGSPVADEAAVTRGSAVVRGLHWVWDSQDGGAGTVGDLQEDDKEGFVAARWPNGVRAQYRASSNKGYDLNYYPRAGEPVTVFTAQAGLRVVRGRNWMWGDQDGGDGGRGKLLVPVDVCHSGDVWWRVAWDRGGNNNYRVGLPSGNCDLKVAGDGS